MARSLEIDGHMTVSTSHDQGETWNYRASPFPGVTQEQRPVLLRLLEGPILFVSFTKKGKPLLFEDSAGEYYQGTGMFAALSFDEGETWTHRRLLTDGGKPRTMDGGGKTALFVMDATHAQLRGYLAATQTPDGIIHLLSTRLHYRFNLSWLMAPRIIAE